MIDTDKYEEKLEHKMNKEFCNYISSGDMQKELAIQYAHEFYVIALDLLADVKELQAWYKLMVRVVNDLRCDLTMMRLDDNHQPQFEDAVRAATKTLSEVIDVD